MRLFAFFLLVLLADPAFADEPPAVETAAQALARDAGEYARQYDVSQQIAEQRLIAQGETVALTDRLAEQYRGRLAGIVIEHKPDWRIVVSLAGDAPVMPLRVRAGGMEVPVVFQTGAKATREQVVWAMTYHQAEIRAALPSAPAIGLDPLTGAMVVVIGRIPAADQEATRARLEAIAHVPVELRILERVDVNLLGDPTGGARLEGVSPDDNRRYVCTSGYTVTDGTRTGIATAAHCLDALEFVAPDKTKAPLTFAGQWGWGYRDVQVNTADAPLSPYFFADTKKTLLRAVTGVRTRAATRSGDFVCHRGERTGYSCSTVDLTDFAPAGDLCGGACLPTWVTVTGPNCKGGDSGSPVFSGTTAFGILKGGSYRKDGSCAFYFYMSVDYLPAPWTLLQQPATPIASPAKPRHEVRVLQRRSPVS